MSATITEFYAAAKTDASLRGQLQFAASAQEVVDIAARRGFNFTAADVESSSRTMAVVELTESDLAGVAGGMKPWCGGGSTGGSTTTWGDPNHNETLIIA